MIRKEEEEEYSGKRFFQARERERKREN